MDKLRRAIPVHVAVVNHRHGSDCWVATSRKELYEQLYEYVKQWWGEWTYLPVTIPADVYEAVSTYFEHVGEFGSGSEFLETFQHELVIPWEG